jgi:hypothetical protein
MSLLKANSVQIGQSVTATQNFTLSVPSSPDGTIKLARGNSGATTADVFSVASDGRLLFNKPPIGSVLQVLQTVKQDTFSTSSTVYTDVTGLSATITPSSSSSKILVQIFMPATNQGQNGSYIRMTSNGSTIAGSLSTSGSATGTANATQASHGFINYGVANMFTTMPLTITYLDSPSSTSPITYQAQTRTGAGGTVYVNYQGVGTTNNNNADYGYYVSTITLMEIAG